MIKNGEEDLLTIGSKEKQIDKYIITDNKSTVRANADTGNIVILTNNNGTGLSDEEYDQNDENHFYNDLYIGDEHIAGGYGFTSPFVRDKILALPGQLQTLTEKVESYHKDSITGGDNGDNSLIEQKITIDPEYYKIDTGDKKYELILDEATQQLSFHTTQKPTISNIVLTYVVEPPSGPIRYYDDIPDSIHKVTDNVNAVHKYSYITFDYEGNDDIESFYLSYNYEVTGKEFTDSDIYTSWYDYSLDFLGKFNEPLNVNESKAGLYEVEDLYRLKDPEYNPNINQKRYKITFGDKIYNRFATSIGNKEAIINMKLHVITTNKTKISKSFKRWTFTHPCLFFTDSNPDETHGNANSSNSNSFILTHNTPAVRVSFSHNAQDSYCILYVPQSILNKYFDEEDLVCEVAGSGIKIKWESGGKSENMLGVNMQEIQYRKFYSTQKYKGITVWNFSLL